MASDNNTVDNTVDNTTDNTFDNTIDISLNTIDKVKKFVSVIAAMEGDYDLVSDRYVVDAKSIMGIFSLDLRNTIRLQVVDGDKLALAKEKLKEFIV